MSAKKSMLRDRGAIAIMTSGGDAPGMNACLRGCVRSALEAGFKVFAILEGYQGLINGDIKELHWDDVSNIIQLGGTVIGTARSAEFRERSGRLKAARNLLEHNIDKLVVIGGDGSLSGAEALRAEFPGLVDELAATGAITQECAARHRELFIAGAVGSIDNDMAGSDYTIGADSALHRIVDALDAITSTAYSHQRTFIIEVMGRNCGHLALMAALASGAAGCFIPEAPPPENWADVLCEHIADGVRAGRRVNLIIAAEGARDINNNKLDAQQIKNALVQRGIDPRITILGHVQRGGVPSAYDRCMSTLFGAETVKILAGGSCESQIAVLQQNRIGPTSLSQAVAKTRAAGQALASGDSHAAAAARGDEWMRMVNIQKTLMRIAPPNEQTTPDTRRTRIGVVTAGRAASGVNSAVRTIIRMALASGAEVLGIEEGPAGLIAGKAHLTGWMEPELWNAFGGSRLGAGVYREKHGDLTAIAGNFRRWQLDGLIVIGDWGGYKLMGKLLKARKRHKEFDIPMIALPASINNDLPGSEYSIGCDTALNNIVDAIDKIRNSTDTAKRTYVVETMGRYCGYLACCAALASGAEYCYTPEKPLSLDDLRNDVRELAAAFHAGNRHTGLIIRNENAHDEYTTDFIATLFEGDGGDEFDVRKAVLGPLQQGGTPSPIDRIQAVRLAYFAVRNMLESIAMGVAGGYFIGSVKGEVVMHNWSQLRHYSDPWRRSVSKRWYSDYEKVIRRLAIAPEIRASGRR
ncbi:MAG: 6-phosphofructokinase [Lentisphaerae bacterium]|nr:6-phosphofructokinase [Lentisphaerota bacterium]